MQGLKQRKILSLNFLPVCVADNIDKILSIFLDHTGQRCRNTLSPVLVTVTDENRYYTVLDVMLVLATEDVPPDSGLLKDPGAMPKYFNKII